MAETEKRTTLSRRDRAIAAVVPLVLIVLAMQQMLVASGGDLSPWKGGGFGMFSTADHVDTRAVRTQLVTVDGPVTVGLGTALEIEEAAEKDLLAELRARPEHHRALQWAKAVVDATQDEEPVSRSSQERVDGAERPEIVGVRVQVWGTEYELATDRVHPRHIITHVIPVPVMAR